MAEISREKGLTPSADEDNRGMPSPVIHRNGNLSPFTFQEAVNILRLHDMDPKTSTVRALVHKKM